MDFTRNALLKLFLAVLTAILLGGGSVLYLDDGDPSTAPVRIIGLSDFADALDTSSLTLPGKGADPDLTIPVDPDNQQDSDDVKEAPTERSVDLHEDARDETPPGVPLQKIEDGQEKAEDLAEELPAGEEPAGAQLHSCPSRPVANQSSLSGPRLGTALHFTVSRPGSINAIRGLFNTPSFGASSNYGIELTGECQRWVPENRKAWAQGAFNSNYVSIEIITNDLSRAQWLASPLIKRGILASLVRDINSRSGAPRRRVDPVGCTPVPGIVDHDALECGNTHWDVGPGFPWQEFIRQVRFGARPASVLTKRERTITKRARYGRGARKARACRMNKAQRRKLRRAGFSKRKRGARYRRLQTNYKRNCK